MITPLINYGLGSIKSTTAPWKIMYYFPGSVTIAWGIAVWFILPADPISAAGLTPRERYIAVARIRSNNAGVRNTFIKADQIKELLVDLKFWLSFTMAMLIFFINGPVSTFVPTIIQGFGYSPLNSLLLTMPSGAVGGIANLAVTFVASKRPGTRCWIASTMTLGSCLAAVLLWQLPLSQKGGLLFASTILPIGLAAYGLVLGLQLANTAGYTKRSASSAGVFAGFCIGNFIGPQLFMNKDAPRFKPGFAVVTSTSAAVSVLILVYRFVCVAHNARRDRAGIEEGFEHAYDDDRTDLKVGAQIPQRLGFCHSFQHLFFSLLGADESYRTPSFDISSKTDTHLFVREHPAASSLDMVMS